MTTSFPAPADPSAISEESRPELPAQQEQRENHCQQESAEPRINVSTVERWASALIGGALLWKGLQRRSLPGAAMAFVGGAMIRRGVTGHSAGYSALGINRGKGEGARPNEYFHEGIHLEERITVNKPAYELYSFWRNFENLPSIMSYLKGVEIIDLRRSRWHALAPAGLRVSWEAEVINDVPGEKIAWRSLYPATVDNAGSVSFVEGPEGRGTEIAVTLDYILPAGNLGWIIAKAFGTDPAAEVREDLRRFKAIMETGEAPTNKGQSHGKRTLYGHLIARD